MASEVARGARRTGGGRHGGRGGHRAEPWRHVVWPPAGIGSTSPGPPCCFCRFRTLPAPSVCGCACALPGLGPLHEPGRQLPQRQDPPVALASVVGILAPQPVSYHGSAYRRGQTAEGSRVFRTHSGLSFYAYGGGAGDPSGCNAPHAVFGSPGCSAESGCRDWCRAQAGDRGLESGRGQWN